MDENKGVPGQAVLPGFDMVLQIESARLAKPDQERFCWEYVTNGGKSGLAYQTAINPECNADNARKRASDLLKKQDITGRIREIVSIIQRKYEHEVIAFRLRTLNFDPKAYFEENGNIKKVVDMDDAMRVGVGLEAKFVEGALRYLPVFPQPEKAADALQKMLGLDKIKAEISGKDGGAVNISDIDLSNRLLTLIAALEARANGS
jgi:hypothetical protein